MRNVSNPTPKSKTTIPPLRRAKAEALVFCLTEDLGPRCYMDVEYDFYTDMNCRFQWTKSEVDRAMNDADLLGIARLTSNARGVKFEIGVEMPEEDGACCAA